MKKNISINISGIIFHIEEDGYETLKDYLDSISAYFANFEDSQEIVADIESRIAEKFLSHLSKSKQVITREDVSDLIKSMGTIEDFQTVEEEDDFDKKTKTSQAGKESREKSPKRLYRDTQHKILGGVASGIAHYLHIDPVWVRLLFILALFDFFLTFSISTLSVLTYIILWIVVPANDHLPEDTTSKKMYRDPQNRVIGGVASGLAAYFNVDVTIIRILFVVLLFMGGTGLVAYLILWLALPEAKSITDKVQMKGEPLTLENIESNLKSSSRQPSEEESTLVKVLLFPFRVLAQVLRWLAKVIGPLALVVLEFLRIVVGIVLLIVSLALLITLFISTGVFLGLWTGSGLLYLFDIPVPFLFSFTTPVTFVAGMLLVGIPALALLLLGLSTLLRRRVANSTVGWTMLAIWLLSLLAFGFSLPGTLGRFKSEAVFSQTDYLNRPDSLLVIDMLAADHLLGESVRLQLRGYDGDKLKLEKRYRAHGRTRQEALEHARQIRYDYRLENNTLYLSSGINLPQETGYYDQELYLTLYIPYGMPFQIKQEAVDIIRNSFNQYDYYASQIPANTWVFNPTGLDCLTCFDELSSTRSLHEQYQQLFEEALEVDEDDQVYEFRDFGTVLLKGPFAVKLVAGDEYRVTIGNYERYTDDLEIDQKGSRLSIIYNKEEPLSRHNRIRVKIICPQLDSLLLYRSARGEVAGFTNHTFYTKLHDWADFDMSLEADTLQAVLTGSSRLQLSGRGHSLQARLSMASRLESFDYLVDNAVVETSGASRAQVFARQELQVKAALISQVQYRGGARLTRISATPMSRVQETE